MARTPYSTAEEFLLFVPSARQVQYTSSGSTRDDDVITAALVDGSIKIDGYLVAGGYAAEQTDAATVEFLGEMTRVIARQKLKDRVESTGLDSEREYSSTIRRLEKIADSGRGLPATATRLGADVSESDSDGVSWSSDDPVFQLGVRG